MEDFDTVEDDFPKCPWCGHIHSSCPDWDDLEENYECHSCGKLFDYEAEYTRTFYCSRVLG